ncbi:MAG: hypothetical protein Q9218_005788, partial [Villophora microphyllina]
MLRMQHLLSFLLVTFALLVLRACAAKSVDWRSRAIYQLLTDRFALSNGSTAATCPSGHQGFCGGTWQGIIRQLDYIQGMGFDAVWISPVTKQIDDPSRAWHGYSQSDLYDINDKFGTAEDLKDLAGALHSRNMLLMVDIVVNHFGLDGFPTLTGYPNLNPFNRGADFHNVCFVDDYTNQTNVEKCWLGNPSYPLADVKTTSASVRITYNSWIKELVSNYSIDGLRIDTVKHVEQDFWSGFQRAAGVFAIGEVADGDVRYVCPYQDHMEGVLNYPMYYQLTAFFSNTSKTTDDLGAQMRDLRTQCKDPTLMGAFSENHDQPRFANTTRDMTLALNVMAFTMLADGIPIMYSGQEQHLAGGNDPFNREAIWPRRYRTNTPLYQFIAKLNHVRKLAIETSEGNYATSLAEVIYSDAHTLALRKGPVVAIYNNWGALTPAYGVELKSTGFGAGNELTDVLSCRTTTVGQDGVLRVTVRGGLPLVLFSLAGLKGSGICGGLTIVLCDVVECNISTHGSLPRDGHRQQVESRPANRMRETTSLASHTAVRHGAISEAEMTTTTSHIRMPARPITTHSQRPVAIIAMESVAKLRYRALPLIASPWEHESHQHHSYQHGSPQSTSAEPLTEKPEPVISVRERRSSTPAFRQRQEASSIELFYDLFFVANLTSFTTVHAIDDSESKRDPSLLGTPANLYEAITSYIGFFAILWFTWLQVVLYDIRFAVDSLFERLAKLIHFGVMVTFAVVGTRFNPSMPHETYVTMRQLSLVLMVSRIVLICQYISAMLWVKKHPRITTPLVIHIAAFAVGAVLCLGFFFTFTATSSGQAYIVWYVIIVMEALAVFVSSSRWKSVSFGHTNLNERCGLLTLIILGEGIIVLTKSMNYVVKGENFSKGICAQIISAVFII